MPTPRRADGPSMRRPASLGPDGRGNRGCWPLPVAAATRPTRRRPRARRPVRELPGPGHQLHAASPTGPSTKARADLIATAQAGQATVAVRCYPRGEKLPKSKLELQAARDALIKASSKRDVTFEQIKTAATTIAGEPAVQIRARQHIAGQPRTVRSTHIYANGADDRRRRLCGRRQLPQGRRRRLPAAAAVAARLRAAVSRRRAAVVVLDACGVGALPDAADYGDAGTDIAATRRPARSAG